jgi:hypothetical protein
MDNTSAALLAEFKARTVAGGPGVLLGGSSRTVNFGKSEFAAVEETERRGTGLEGIFIRCGGKYNVR